MKTICGIDILIHTDVPAHLQHILRGARGLDRMSWREALDALDGRTIMRVLDALKGQLTEGQRRDVRELAGSYVIRAVTQTEAFSGYPVERKSPRAALVIQEAIAEVSSEVSSLAAVARHCIAAVADQHAGPSRSCAARKDEFLFQVTALREVLRAWDVAARSEEQKTKGEQSDA